MPERIQSSIWRSVKIRCVMLSSASGRATPFFRPSARNISIFSPSKPGPTKNTTYECGLESKDDVLIHFRPEYYLYAIIFLIFDVEVIFLLPFAVAFTGLTIGPAIAMLVFLLLLAEGLVWAWQKGVLTWV